MVVVLGGLPMECTIFAVSGSRNSAWGINSRRIHLSSGHTPQVVSPIGLDLKLSKRALEEPPKTPLE